MANQPLEANFFPGILEGLVGRLGLAVPGVTKLPTSIREGVTHHFTAALKDAIRRTEGDVNLGQATDTVEPHGLHLNYDLDFQTQRVDDIAPMLTSPLLPGLIGNILNLEKPEMPRQPASFKADAHLWGSSRTPPDLEVPGPFPSKESAPKEPTNKEKAAEGEPLSQEGTSWKQAPPRQVNKEVPTIVISEDDTPIPESTSSPGPRSA